MGNKIENLNERRPFQVPKSITRTDRKMTWQEKLYTFLLLGFVLSLFAYAMVKEFPKSKDPLIKTKGFYKR